MRNISMGKLIELSINRTKLVLFQPFSLRKWLCLLFIAFLAGAVGSSSGSGGRNVRRGRSTVEAAECSLVVDGGSNDAAFTGDYIQDALYYGQESQGYQTQVSRWQDFPFAWFTPAFGLFLVGAVLLLGVLSIWLRARFKFVWLSSVIKNDASVAGPFRLYKQEGNSLFWFYMAIGAVAVIFFAFIGFWIFRAGIAGSISGPEAFWPILKSAISNYFLPGLLVVCGLVFLILLTFAVEHFVVPVMARDNLLFSQGWEKFIGIYDKNRKEFWFFLLIFIGLAILGGIIAIILALITLLIVALAAAVLFGLPYLLLALSLNAMPIFVFYAVIAGIPFIALVILLFASIDLPFAVFFRSFSLYFLSSLGQGGNFLET